jgi:hypothetical protein
LFRDLRAFAREHNVWWIVPVVAVLLLIGIVVAASQAATPFLYTFF